MKRATSSSAAFALRLLRLFLVRGAATRIHDSRRKLLPRRHVNERTMRLALIVATATALFAPARQPRRTVVRAWPWEKDDAPAPAPAPPAKPANPFESLFGGGAKPAPGADARAAAARRARRRPEAGWREHVQHGPLRHGRRRLLRARRHVKASTGASRRKVRRRRPRTRNPKSAQQHVARRGAAHAARPSSRSRATRRRRVQEGLAQPLLRRVGPRKLTVQQSCPGRRVPDAGALERRRPGRTTPGRSTPTRFARTGPGSARWTATAPAAWRKRFLSGVAVGGDPL